MTFRANSMTYRIDPSRFEFLPDYRLKEEYEEFSCWFSANASGMSRKDAAMGRLIVTQLEEILYERKQSSTGKYYIDRRTSTKSGSQLRLFPAL